MSYWLSDYFRQGGLLWPKNIQNNKPARKTRSFHYPSLPALTQTVQNSIASQQAIFPSQSEWVKTRPSADCTAEPEEHASVSGKGRLCRAQSCPKQPSFVSSSASAMSVRLRPLLTSAKLTSEQWNDCLKKQADGGRISIDSNWSGWISHWKRSNWMSCTLAWPKGQKRGETPTCRGWFALQNGSQVGSRGTGGREPVCYRPACRPTHPGIGQRTGSIGGPLLWQKPPTPYAYRRAPAISSGYPACLWTDQTSTSTQERSWSKMQTHSQATAWVVGRSGQKAPRCQRQPAEGYNRRSVRTPQRHQESYSRTGYRLQDKHFSSGTIERDVAKPADAFGQAYSQRLAAGLHVAMGIVAVAGFVQLDEGSYSSGGSLPSDGVGFGWACLVGSGIYSLSCTCQRPPARAGGRATQECSGIGFGCLST